MNLSQIVQIVNYANEGIEFRNISEFESNENIKKMLEYESSLREMNLAFVMEDFSKMIFKDDPIMINNQNGIAIFEDGSEIYFFWANKIHDHLPIIKKIFEKDKDTVITLNKGIVLKVFEVCLAYSFLLESTNKNKRDYFLTLTEEKYKDVCLACGKKAENMKRCSGCKVSNYCSRECQKNNWNNHKSICEKLKSSSDTKN